MRGRRECRDDRSGHDGAYDNDTGRPGKNGDGGLRRDSPRRNADSLWRLLSAASKERLGPTLAQFRNGAAAALTKGVGSFGRFRTIVSERITDELGVVAIDGTRAGKPGVYAAALRLEGEQWKFELGGPVKVRPIGPDQDAREPVVAQIAAAVQGPGGTGTAVMYLDGRVVNPEVRGTSANSTSSPTSIRRSIRGGTPSVLFASDDRGGLRHRLGLHRREEIGRRPPGRRP